MLAWTAILILQSSSQVFYHFGKSFGQVYRDRMYSSSRVAVSGSSSEIDGFDTLATDRGAYIPNHSAGIRVYPNDISSETTLISGAFTAAIWHMVVPYSDGIIFLRMANGGGAQIFADYYGSKRFFLSVCNSGCQGSFTPYISITTRNHYSASWLLIGVVIDGSDVKIYTNDSPLFTLSLPSTYIETSVEHQSIGVATFYYGTVGYVWYYHHIYSVTSFSSFIYQSPVTSCFYSGCTECSPSIVDPVFQMTGCTSYQTDPYTSSSGPCNAYCSSTCIDTSCLDCSCSPSLCTLSSSQSVCDCGPGATLNGNTCTCSQTGYYFNGAICIQCRADCVTCINGITCVTCSDLHASPGTNGCVCHDGYYANGLLHQGGICVVCNTGCLTCTSSLCITCISANAEPNTSGGCSCINGYYAVVPQMTSISSCNQCHPHCSTCSDSLTCLTCIVSSAILSTSGCACSTGFYPSGSMSDSSTYCASCSSECLTCTDGVYCVQCLATNSGLNSNLVCVCNSGYYQNDIMSVTTACSPCHSDCLTCSGPDICITCLSANSSPKVDIGCECNSGYYRSTVGGLYSCLPCSNDCSTCNDPNICTTCKEALSNPSTTVGCDCINGYYKIVSGTSYACLPCATDCASCTSGNTCSVCKASGAVFNGLVCQCLQGFYPSGPFDLSTTFCIACMNSCTSCVDGISCSQCVAFNSLPDASGICMCNSGYYQSDLMSLTTACIQCHPDCQTCTQALICNTCKASFSSPDSSSGCICYSGYYRSLDSTGSYICLPCLSDCLTCSSLSICDSCLVSLALPQPTGCACPTQTFPSGPLTLASSTCSSCLTECLSCLDAVSCIQCVATLTFIDSSGRCVCNSGYYAASPLSFTNACTVCNADCLTCNGPSLCLTCIDINSIPSPSSGCVCNSGFFRTIGANGLYSCVACSAECITCSSAGTCDSCIAIYAVLINGVCTCPSGFGGASPLTSSSSCFQCGNGCGTCNSFSSCLSCLDPNSFIDISGACLCSDGFYKNVSISNSFNCLPCHSHCQTCSDALKCLTCKSLNSDKNLTAGCNCLTGFYAFSDLNETNACLPCNSNCTACLNASFCTSCAQNFYLNSSSMCSDCHPTCLGCKDRFTCESCKDSNASQSKEGCECNNGTFFNLTTETCSPCLNICASCNSSNSCLSCKLNKTYAPLCKECDKSCESCTGGAFYECSSCSSLLLKSVCSATCPVGFTNTSGVCKQENSNMPTLKFLFQGFGETFYDLINGVGAVVKQGRRLSSGLPFAVYKRGIYFPGGSFLEIRKNDSKLLNVDFSFSVWLRPNNSDSVFLSKSSLNQPVLNFRLFIENQELKSLIFLGNSTFSYSSGLKPVLDSWNHLYFSCNYSSNTSVSMRVNDKQGPVSVLSHFPFIDTDGSSLLLGSDENNTLYYIGYIFSVELYASEQLSSQLVSITSCSNCDVCFPDKSCIPNCEIGQVYQQTSRKCVSCPLECPNSCKDSSTCLSCVDDYCESCNTYEANSCYLCLPGYEVQNTDNTCKKCESSAFYDQIGKTCIQCPVLCQTCTSSISCLSCFKDSSVKNEGLCMCDLGFSLVSSNCIRNRFNVTMTLNQDNEANLWFSEDLSADLKASQVKVILDGTKVAHKVERIDSRSFKVIFDLEKLQKNSIVEIFFIQEVTSKVNSLLDPGVLSQETVLTDALQAEIVLLQQAKASKKLAKTGATAGVSVAVGISFMNFDPSSFFDFMNTAEMFYSVCLFNLELNPILSEFLMGLRIHNQIPKLFSRFIDMNQGAELDKKYKRFGFSTDLFLINTAVHLQTLLILMTVGILVFLITRIAWIGTKLQFLINMFRYGIFLRFWLQTFFELTTALGVTFRHSKQENLTQKIDFIICWIYHAVILVSLINGVADKSEQLTDICMKIILTAWLLNIIISLSNTTKTIIDKIKDFLAKRRAKLTQDKYKTKTAPEPGDGDCKIVELE